MQVYDKTEIEKAGRQILHPGSRQLFRYWEGLRAERPCPTREEINLRQIKAIVSNLVILETGHKGESWVFRLAGSRVGELLQRKLTGANALQGWDAFETKIISKSWAIAFDRLQPCLVRMRLVHRQGNVVGAEMIVLPVIDQTTGETQLFGGVFAFTERQAEMSDPLLRLELVSARMIWTEHQNADELLDQVGRFSPPPFRVIQGGLV